MPVILVIIIEIINSKTNEIRDRTIKTIVLKIISNNYYQI